jgi:hypothetical protein
MKASVGVNGEAGSACCDRRRRRGEQRLNTPPVSRAVLFPQHSTASFCARYRETPDSHTGPNRLV